MPIRRKKRQCNNFLNFTLNILNLIFLTSLILKKSVAIKNNITSISWRAQCAVDCYAKCANDKIVCFLNFIN